ncbi:uncharacterized protein Z518_05086 [Rhinocladiella mackenziei CBS 650.93]|uniref:Uncharacterized protein n=1 Tax=Rhinocladiella mackenziei CBS 650.93 TaxID=1442369 RepID=A0A0D2IMV0_9EURO|nr:uncharacterized protein Z518_05086 [Rhinocladiella mackenziei CBS 650.93]KIX07109.1 hypothetical protein Z518_05086 [Rhinocladiella mackenziei CBS 650.93]
MESNPSPRNNNPLQQFYGSRKSLRWVAFLVIAALATLYMTGQNYGPVTTSRKAKYLTPAELMKRPISKDLQTIPKLIHQSWSSTELPAKFERWSTTCRQQHPDWEWVLWTDEDNDLLVKTHFPWLLKTYQSLPSVIYRVDLVRNLYLYMFGGVYADLDVECLRPSDEMFTKFNVSTISHAKPRHQSQPHMQKSGRKAFFGRMGVDTGSSNSIPNAWMASTPGHPFFLVVLESVMRSLADGSAEGQSPESVTGPGRLYDMIKIYQEPESRYEGEKIDKHVAKNPTAKQFTPRKGLGHSIEVLHFSYIYPYSWERDGEIVRDICWAAKKSFDADRCKQLLATDRWPSYAITYWSHTWTGDGHDEGNVRNLDDR